jgi:hypothetical protein
VTDSQRRSGRFEVGIRNKGREFGTPLTLALEGHPRSYDEPEPHVPEPFKGALKML